MKQVYGWIYLITCLVDLKKYIGQTVQNPSKRWNSHKSISKMPNNPTKHYLHKAMDKHGIENFTFELIFTSFNKEDLDFMEDFFIAQYQSLSTQNGYNLHSKARGTGRDSEQTKAKRNKSLEWMRKIVEAKNIETGEIREYQGINVAAKDLKCHASAISLICRKDRGAFNAKGWTFRFKGEEWAKPSSLYSKGIPEPIISVSHKTGETNEYPSMTSAEKDGFNMKMISRVCLGLNKTHKKHKFYYKKDFNINQEKNNV